MPEPVILDRLRQQPLRELRAVARGEWAQPKAALQFRSIAAARQLGRQHVPCAIRANVDLLRHEREERRRQTLVGV